MIKSLLRGLTRNHARLEPSADDPALRPPALASAPADVADEIQSWVASQPRWRLVSRRDDAETVELHLTRTTRVFRFTDDIQVNLSARGDHQTLVNAQSRSRVGKGDLGQNRRNLKELLAVLSF